MVRLLLGVVLVWLLSLLVFGVVDVVWTVLVTVVWDTTSVPVMSPFVFLTLLPDPVFGVLFLIWPFVVVGLLVKVFAWRSEDDAADTDWVNFSVYGVEDDSADNN